MEGGRRRPSRNPLRRGLELLGGIVSTPTSEPSTAISNWAYIRLPMLQLEYWQSEENLYDHPLVVACQTKKLVVQCSRLASELGIRPAMGLADAWLMSERLLHQYHSPQREASLLHTLALLLYNHFADITIDQQQQGLWLNLKPLKRLFSSNQQITSVVSELLTSEINGLSFRLTFASNPWLAQLGVDDYAQPFAQAIESYPIQRCFLPPALQQNLLSMGLVTLGQLSKIPSRTLGKKLGAEVVMFLARLRGEIHQPMQSYQPTPGLYISRQLNSEVYTWEALRFACKSLLQALEQALNSQQQATQSFTLWLFERGFTGNPAVQPQSPPAAVDKVIIQLARPSWKAADFFSILQLKMEKTRFRAPIVDLALQVDGAESRALEDRNLYAGGESASDLNALLNRLQARLGTTRFFALQSASSWLPEEQQRPISAGQVGASELYPLHGWRPPWLIQPLPTNIEHWHIHRQPQRLATPWWRRLGNECNHRDYVLAQSRDGRWGWVFYQPAATNTELKPGWYQQGWAS